MALLRGRWLLAPHCTGQDSIALNGQGARLACYFGTDAQSWLNLQLSYDLKIAEAELKDRIEREVEEMAA
jgi:plasmid maintenance system antidote protein VapI